MKTTKNKNQSDSFESMFWRCLVGIYIAGVLFN